MKYSKPEVGLPIPAIQAVQNPLNKANPQQLDSAPPSEEMGSISAYAADE